MSSHLCVLILFVLSGVFGAGTDEVKSVSVNDGDSVTLNTDVQVQKDDHILWTFGPQDTRIAEIHRQKIYIDGTDIFEKRLQIDSQTGSLTIRNIRSEHTGLYKLIVISSRKTQKRFSVTVYQTTKPTQTSYNSISLITVVCALVLLLFISVCVCCCRKCNREKTDDQESMLEYTEIIYRLQI